MKKIRKGDAVIVLAGRDKGKRGTVLRVMKDERVLVDNVNVIKKHVRPNPNKGETGVIIEKEAPVRTSNVALYNPNTKKADRSGIKILEDGRKVRVFISDGEVVDLILCDLENQFIVDREEHRGVEPALVERRRQGRHQVRRWRSPEGRSPG